MHAALEALLTEVIDYAGLFPPAELPLETAVRNYADCQTQPEAWMLGRFICPASRLDELIPPAASLFARQRPLRVSVTLGGVNDLDAFVNRCNEAREAIAHFREAAGEAGTVEMGEIQLAPALVEDDTVFARWRELVGGERGCAALPENMMLFYEIPLTGQWRRSAGRLVDWIAARDTVARTPMRGAAGFKLRCGGPAASAVPSTRQVAWIIQRCREGEVPLKFAGGLRHPMRHYDTGARTFAHGFLNVFIAGVLSHALALDEGDICGILDEIDLRQFRFTDEAVGWADAEADIAEILVARRSRIISLESSSFDEPREHLTDAGLM